MGRIKSNNTAQEAQSQVVKKEKFWINMCFYETKYCKTLWFKSNQDLFSVDNMNCCYTHFTCCAAITNH